MASHRNHDSDQRLYLASIDPPYCSLNVASSFAILTPTEKRYAHHIGRAGWAGARIILDQWTPHASAIFDMLIAAFSTKDGSKLADLDAIKSASGVSDCDWEASLQWSAQVGDLLYSSGYQTHLQVITNLANYRSFGSSKIIPRVGRDEFRSILAVSENKASVLPMWDEVSIPIILIALD
jgi:dipeptidyl-peptidase-3